MLSPSFSLVKADSYCLLTVTYIIYVTAIKDVSLVNRISMHLSIIFKGVRLFADDTAVYLTVNSHEAANTLQADLDTLQEWELTWDMDVQPR